MEGPNGSLPFSIKRFATRVEELTIEEVERLQNTHGLSIWGASGDSEEKYNIDGPGRIVASGNAVIRAKINTDQPVVIGGSGSATVIVSGNRDAVVQANGSADFSVEGL